MTRPSAFPADAPGAPPAPHGAGFAPLPGSAGTGLYTLPFLFVLGYLLVDYGRPHNWIPALGMLRPGVLVLGGGILSLVISQRALSVPPAGKYMLAFLVLMAGLVPFSFNPRVAFDLTWNFALFLFGAALPLMAFVDSHARLRVLLRFWMWIHVVLALYSITHRGVGIGSFLADENDFALALNMALPYAVALFFIERNTLARVLLVAACLILLIAITATMSRGGFVGLVCVGLFILARSPRKMVSLALVVGLAGVAAIATPRSYWAEMETISSANREGDTGAARLYLWGIGWRMFRDHPVFGVGPGNYQYNNIRYETARVRAQGRHVWGTVAHSLYFTLLPEFGLVGTMLFAAMIVHSVRERRRLRRACRARLQTPALSPGDRERATELLQLSAAMDASLLTFLVTGSFITVLYYPHVWLLTAFSAAMVRIGEPSSAEPDVRVATPMPPYNFPGGARDPERSLP